MQIYTFIMLALLYSLAAYAEEPALPGGLDDLSSEPDLPMGLDSSESDFPKGFNDEGSLIDPVFTITGFIELRSGQWIDKHSYQAQRPLNEARLQLELEREFSTFTFTAVADLIYDDVTNDRGIALENGNGWLDLRTANAVFSPTPFMDIRLGRQILTWGTGDLLFINDLFPKDWNAFLIGREVEYLKAPSDAIKISLFNKSVNLDLVYTPRFDADRYIDGSRASYFNSTLGRLAGTDAVTKVDRPNDWLHDDELALRLYKNIAAYELALYGYNGFWKSPGGLNPTTGRALFPDLAVYGASIRGPLASGIANAEWGYYDSQDDRSGRNPMINNSEQRLILGYEQEIATNLTLGMQYYLKHMEDYAHYRRTLPAGAYPARRSRQEYTLRLTWLTMNQNLIWSLFSFHSPSDNDGYLRARLHYKHDDHLSLEVGGNLFWGDDQQTFLGQFQNNDNLYTALRYGF
ncbi:MAG: hypothetical protein L3J26_07850 [Candidatus Polarisedimenticolaceae bacterium]|nr:hypothetical protein [Candidatus Polarisedimenticolaceae bacterium]